MGSGVRVRVGVTGCPDPAQHSHSQPCHEFPSWYPRLHVQTHHLLSAPAPAAHAWGARSLSPRTRRALTSSRFLLQAGSDHLVLPGVAQPGSLAVTSLANLSPGRSSDTFSLIRRLPLHPYSLDPDCNGHCPLSAYVPRAPGPATQATWSAVTLGRQGTHGRLAREAVGGPM